MVLYDMGSYSTGSENTIFRELQCRLRSLYAEASESIPRTVVVVPSLTLAPEDLRGVRAVLRYEERSLPLLHLLRDPLTRIVYVTSKPLARQVVEYALDLVPGLLRAHALQRLSLVDCADSGPEFLSEKLLRRPDLIKKIRREITSVSDSCLVTFNATPLERQLTVALGIPLHGCDPELAYLGLKSGGRRMFRKAGVVVPDGVEDLRDESDVVQSLTAIRLRDASVSQAVIKLNDSFGGTGNALFSFADAPSFGLADWVARELPRRVRFACSPCDWSRFLERFSASGGVVERYIEGGGTHSPAAQVEILPSGSVHVLSVCDQVLGGDCGQIFTGCIFPADERCRIVISELAMRTGKVLAAESVTGIVSMDFVCQHESQRQQHFGIEINIRTGGGTPPLMLVQGLTGGQFDAATGEYRLPWGGTVSYVATDRLEISAAIDCSPDALISWAAHEAIHYDVTTGTGIVFYLLGGAAEAHNVGVLAVGRNDLEARQLFERVRSTLGPVKDPRS